VARKPTGKEVTPETPELAAPEGQRRRRSPEELVILAKRLARTKDPAEAAVLRERLTCGFYGTPGETPQGQDRKGTRVP
jgi:hypothetical protein